MNKTLYSNLDELSILESGLINIENQSLMNFIIDNNATSVGTFLRMMDEHTYINKSVFNDVINEALGIADLLKYKYLDNELIVDCYLSSNITTQKHEICGNKYSFPCVKDYNGNSINIYSALTRLGFSDRERTIILNKNINLMIGRTLYDVLLTIYIRFTRKEKLTDAEQILLNKILYIISSHMRNKDITNCKGNIQDMYYLKQINELINKSQILDIQLTSMKKQIYNHTRGCASSVLNI